MRRRIVWGGSAAILMVLIIAAATPVYWVRHDGLPSQLLWSAERAHLFIASNAVGYQPSHLKRALLRFVPAPFGLPEDDTRRSVDVITITSSGVEKQKRGNTTLPALGVVGDVVASAKTFWMGDTTRALSVPEQVQVVETAYLNEFSDIHGWSKRTLHPFIGGNEELVTFALGRQQVRLRVFSPEPGIMAVDIERDGGAAERLWSLDQRGRVVSEDVYESAFRPAWKEHGKDDQ